MEDQLKLSDMIIINKIDLVTDDSLEKIDKQLSMICASIPTYKTTYGQVSLEELTYLVKTERYRLIITIIMGLKV